MAGVTTFGLVLLGLVIAVGLAGVILPVLPGILLCWAAVLVWALFERTGEAWVFFSAATLLALVSQLLKYLIPGQRMRAAEVPWTTMAIGGAMGIVGFFVLPVVGLPVGFVLGVYLGERSRLAGSGQAGLAWPSTVEAVKAVGVAILIELAAGLLIGAGWLGMVLFR